MRNLDGTGTIFNKEQLNAAIDWLLDLTFQDEVDFDELTDQEIERAVDRHFDGGILEFLKTF